MACSDIGSVMQIQRKLQIQIENQGKHLEMMFEKQREMGDNKGTSSPTNTPSLDRVVDNLETSTEEHDKLRSSTGIPEESSKDASTKQMVDEAEVSNEHERVGDQFANAPPTKRVKVQ